MERSSLESTAPIVGPPPRHVLRNVMFAVLMKSQSAVFSYLSTLLLLRAMQVEEFGTYSVLFTGIMLNVTLLGQIGMPSLLVRFIPQYYARRQFHLIDRLGRSVQLIQSAVAAVIAIVVWIAAPQIALWMHAPESTGILRVFAIGVAVFIVQENYRVLLNGLFNQRAIFNVNMAYNAVRLIALYTVTTRAYSLMGVVIVEVAALIAALSFYVLAYRRAIRKLSSTSQPSIEPLPWPRLRRYAGLCYINEVGVTLTGIATDLLIVSALLGGSAAGFYGLANRIITLVRGVMPSRVLSSVIEPLFFSEYGDPRGGSTRFAFVLLSKVLLWVSVPAMTWLAIMSRGVIVYFFDVQYAAAAPVVSLLALAIIIDSLKWPYGLVLQSAERNDLIIYTKISGVLKLGFGLWLVPIGGVVVMAAVTLGATLLEVGLLEYYTVTRLHLRNDWTALLRLMLNGAFAGAILWVAQPIFTGRIGVILSMPAFSVLYLALNRVHRAFDPNERQFINKKLPKPVWIF